MTTPFVWVDGPFGGTPVTAANLNAAMGVSDAAIANQINTPASATQAALNATYGQRANNLSDLASAATARTNLGLGDSATHPASDFAPATGSSTYETQSHAASTYAPISTDVPKWQATTAYTAGQQVISPAGDIVAAVSSFTSGATYNPTNWNYVRIADYYFNVKAYGAKGDGSTDDTTAITNALTAAATNGGVVFFPAGTYITGTQNIPSKVKLQGVSVDGTTLKLKSGTNADLLTVANFGTLTGTTSNGGASKFAIRDMTLDGNKANNTSGWVMRIFAFDYKIDSVEFLRGSSGGVWAEWGTGGSNMESSWSNFKIGNCDSGNGFEVRGPHDSLFTNGIVFRDSSNTPTRAGIGVNIAGYGSGQFNNIHVWGGWNQQWQIAGGQLLTNCVSDGPGGVTVLSDFVEWIGGAIYSDGITPGDVGITFGDGTTRTIRNCRFVTWMNNFKSNNQIHRLRANTTPVQNKFDIVCNAGPSGNYTVGESYSQLASDLSGTWTSITLVDASSFPTSGNIYIGDASNSARVGYTGKSGNTLTGISAQTTAIAAATSAVWLFSSNTGADFWEISNPFASGKGFYQTPLTAGMTRNFQESLVAFGTVTLNSNTATLTGKASSGNTTLKLDPTSGIVQPGTTAGTGARIWSGSGAPTTPGGSLTYNLGDAYLRTDTPSTANQRLYVVTTAGTSPTWTGIL